MNGKTSEKKRYPLGEGLFTWPSDEPQLIGGRCKSCGTYFFPKFNVKHDPICKNRQAEEVLLGRRGKLESYTVQRFPPPPPFVSPDPFVPYAIGWVALPENIGIVGIITGCRLEDIKMHMDVELVIEKAWEDKEGNEPLTWKWRPV
jgi:uncharacterized OB-fold protein